MEGEDKPVAKNRSFKLNSSLLSVAAVTVLFLISFYLWTSPFQENKIPFGEGDSAWHFAIGDNIAETDNAPFRLPYYVGVWYYGFNDYLGPFAPEYAPSNHVNYALMQIFGGDRFIPVLIFRAVASFLGAIAVFFMVSKLFGVLPGFLAGLGLTFSLREQMTYLFGQQPTLIAMVIAPVTLYAWYKYLVSFYESDNKKRKNIYLFMTVALLASQYLLHVQGFVASIVIMAVLTTAMIIRFRKLPISKSSIVPIGIATVLLLAVMVPFAAIYLGTPDADKLAVNFDMGRLLQWGVSPEEFVGSFPPTISLFLAQYSILLVPFLVAGMLLLLIRLFTVKNNTKEIFLLSWLIGVYIVLHLDVFMGTNLNRVVRMLVFEHYIFFTLMAVSVIWLPQLLSQLLKGDKQIMQMVKYSSITILAVLLTFTLIFTAGKATYSGSSVNYNGIDYSYGNIKDSYQGISRITPTQVEFSEWLTTAVPEDAFIYDPSIRVVGQWRYPKMRWMLGVSQRHIGRYDGGEIIDADFKDPDKVYFMFDYSDIALFASNPQSQQQGIAWGTQLQEFEQEIFNVSTLVYDTNNIRLYKYEGGQ
jgi:hypothetical protein